MGGGELLCTPAPESTLHAGEVAGNHPSHGQAPPPRRIDAEKSRRYHDRVARQYDAIYDDPYWAFHDELTWRLDQAAPAARRDGRLLRTWAAAPASGD